MLGTFHSPPNMHEAPDGIRVVTAKRTSYEPAPVKLSGGLNPLWHAGAMLILPVLIEWIYWRLGGPSWVGHLDQVTLVCSLGYGLLGQASVILLLPRQTRKLAAAFLLCCVVGLTCLVFSAIFAEQIRENAKFSLAQNSQGIIDAIGAFEADRGSTPRALEELVPEYLAELPSTGMSAHPQYKYTTSSHAPGDWILGIPIDRSRGDTGLLMYKPDERYIKVADGNCYQDIGVWAFKYQLVP